MSVSEVMNMPVEVVTAYLCRQSFAQFAKEFWPEVPGAGERPTWNWHMDVLCDEIQRVAERVFRGVTKEYDLVCNISPGTSKSTLFSILFPAWTWTRMPSCRHLSATHTDMLALDLAAKSRTVVKSEKYRACFPEVTLRGDQDTKSYYANTAGGDRLTCTVGGKSPMGFHAHFITVDDPIDPKKVMSELELKTAKEFMTQVIPTRKVDKATSVTFLVMQRLHEEDPAGVMLGSHDEDGGRRVRHICLPAELAENVSPPELKSYYVGGLMDPVRLGAPVLAEYKKTLSAYAYAGQFMQSPVPLGGGMFKEFYFNQRVKAAPYQAKRIRYWDRASTEDGGCYTAGVLMAKDSDGNYYVEHCTWGQWEPYERNQRMLATAIRDRGRYGPRNEPVIHVEAEGGSSGKDAFKGVVKALAGFYVKEDRVTGDKVTRANPWSAQLAAKNVYFVDDGSWDLDAYVREHCSFPLGRYKDQVDASCLVAGTLVETSGGQKPIEQIRAGEFVLTRKGYREVVWAGQSGTTSTVVTVYFANGSSVSGTKDHLVWTQGRGYISLCSLREDDVVLSVGRGSGPCRKKAKASASFAGRRSVKITQRNAVLGPAPLTGGGTLREENTTTRLRSSAELSIGGGSRTADTSGAEVTPFIAPSGVTTTETFPVAMTFTTRTGTRLTTSLVILNALLLKNTPLSIPEEGLSTDSASTWTALGNWRLNGIGPTKAGDGTRSTASGRGKVGGKRSTNVVGVLRSSSPGEPDQSSAPSPAERRIGRSGRGGGGRKNASVLGAKKSSTAQAKRNAVPGSAGPDSGGIVHVTPVYDLTVDGEHEFFANGVLVHNSGAFNLLTGMRADVSIQCVQIRPKGPRDGLRLVIATPENLKTVVVEEKTLLVRFRGLLDADEPLAHGIVNLLDTLDLRFEPIHPPDHQETWDDPVPPLNLPAADLMMSWDHGKKLWAFLLKKRDPPASAVVFVCDKDRAEAACYAVCDKLRPRLPKTPRPQVYLVGQGSEERHGGEAVNRHVYDTVRACRNLVVA